MFKNARVYRVHQAAPSSEQLHNMLCRMVFQDVSKYEAHRIGFSPVYGKSSPEMALSIAGMMLIKFTEQKKLLPPSVVKDRLDKECEKEEEKQGFPPRRRERQIIKERIVEEMLPQAFPKTKHTYVLWDVSNSLIIIDASSEKEANSALDGIRMALESLKVTPLAVREPIARTMTGWLTDPSKRENDIIPCDRVQLRGNDDGIIAARYMDLDGEEVQAALNSGRQVTKMAIHIEGFMQCMLHEDFTIKQIAFDDELIDEANDQYDGNEASKIDAETAVCGSALVRAITKLINALGGEQPAAVAENFSLEQE